MKQQPHNFQMPMSPNANSAIWVMLDQHYTDSVYGGYNSFFALLGD